MAQCADGLVLDRGLGLAVNILEHLTASLTGVVFIVAGFGTGRILCLSLIHLVAQLAVHIGTGLGLIAAGTLSGLSAVLGTGCVAIGNIILIQELMIQSGDNLLCLEVRSTSGAVITCSQTGFGTGRCHSCISDGIMAQRILIIALVVMTADRAGVQGVTLSGTLLCNNLIFVLMAFVLNSLSFHGSLGGLIGLEDLAAIGTLTGPVLIVTILGTGYLLGRCLHQIMLQGGNGFFLGILAQSSKLSSVNSLTCYAALGIGGHGSDHAVLRLSTSAIGANLGCHALGIASPLIGGSIPSVTGCRNGSGFGLSRKCLIIESSRESSHAGFQTGCFLGGLASGSGSLSLHMGCIVLTGAGCNALGVVLDPLVSRCIPVVGQSGNGFFRSIGSTELFKSSSVNGLTRNTTLGIGGHGSDHALFRLCAGAIGADTGCHALGIAGPLVGRSVPGVTGCRNGSSGSLLLESGVGEDCGVSSHALFQTGCFLGGLAGGSSGLSLHMGYIVLTDTGCNALCVVLDPLVSRCIPVVGQSGNGFFRSIGSTELFKSSSVNGLTRNTTLGIGGHGSDHALFRLCAGAIGADTGCHALGIAGPLVGRSVPGVTGCRNGSSGSLLLESGVGEDCGVSSHALFQTGCFLGGLAGGSNSLRLSLVLQRTILVGADAGCGALGLILTPGISRITESVVGGIQFLCLYRSRRNLVSLEHLAAIVITAGPVSIVTALGTSRCLSLCFHQIVLADGKHALCNSGLVIAIFVHKVLLAVLTIEVTFCASFGAGRCLVRRLGHLMAQLGDLTLCNSCRGIAILIHKVLLTGFAVEVALSTGFGTGGSLCLGLGHLVAQLGNGLGFHGSLLRTGIVLIDQAAIGTLTGPVLIVTILGTGSCLGVGLDHCVAQSRQLLSGYRGRLRTFLILEGLLADIAGVVLIVTCSGTGVGYCSMLRHLVTLSLDGHILQRGLVLTLGILVELPANLAGIVCLIAVIQAVRILGRSHLQGMAGCGNNDSCQNLFAGNIRKLVRASCAGVVLNVTFFGTSCCIGCNLGSGVGCLRKRSNIGCGSTYGTLLRQFTFSLASGLFGYNASTPGMRHHGNHRACGPLQTV